MLAQKNNANMVCKYLNNNNTIIDITGMVGSPMSRGNSSSRDSLPPPPPPPPFGTGDPGARNTPPYNSPGQGVAQVTKATKRNQMIKIY